MTTLIDLPMTDSFPAGTACATFHQLADQVHGHLTPAGRATAVAASLRQIGDLAGDLPLSLTAAAASYQILALAQPSDTPPTLTRRATCLELADLAGQQIPIDGPATSILDRLADLSHMVAILDHLAKAFGQSAMAKMAKTAMRESSELTAYIHHISPARE